MRLSTLIAKDKKLDIRDAKKKGMVRSMIKDLARRNNPKQDQTPGLVGDGGADESPTDNSTVGLL